MGAVNGEDLQLVGGNPPHPARNVAGVAIPGAYKRVAIGCQPGFADGELRHWTECYPRQLLLHLLSPGRAEDVANHRYREQSSGYSIQCDAKCQQHVATRYFLRAHGWSPHLALMFL